MEPLLDPEELIPCPYDPVHMFRSKRLIYHLEKCRKNHPTSHFKKCEFNASHIIPAPEFMYHLKICPDRGRLELEVFHENHQYKQKGDTSLPPCDWTPPAASESWDDDNVRFEPKLNEQLFEEETPKIKPLKAKTSKKPPSPEKWRMPHSLPMTGPIKTSGGRGRGRGITKKLLDTRFAPSGLQQNGGSSAHVMEQSSLPTGLGQSNSGSLHSHEMGQSSLPPGLGQPNSGSVSLSQGQPHSVDLSSLPPGLGQPHSGPSVNFMGQSSLSQGQPHFGSLQSHVIGQPSLPPGLGPGSNVMSQSSLPPGLGQPHSGPSVNLMGQSSLSQGQPQSMGLSSLPPGLGQPHSVSNVMGQSSLPSGLGHPSLSQPVFNAFGTNGQPAGRGLAQPQMYQLGLSQNPFVPSGLGRGGYGRGALCLGRGKMALPSHNATINGNGLNGVVRATPTGSSTNLKSAGLNNVQSPPPAPTPPVEEMEENEEEIRKRKNIRKLKKALRQVEELEVKQKSGAMLTPEQVAKLNRKADLLLKLQEIETDEVE